MKKSAVAVFVLFVLLVSACSALGSSSLGEAGQQVTVAGEVESVDLSPMAADGPARILLQTQEYGQVTLLVSPCFGDCARQAVEQLEVVEAGQSWRATGELQGDNEIALYMDGVHLLEPAGG